MLSFVFKDIKGHELIMSTPLSAVIRMEEDVPADSLLAVFPYTECRELKTVTVYNSAKAVFVGVIDEEEHIVTSKGAFLRISARSLAALLLDNEAAPQIYEHPSAKLIYERYVKDCGITAADADDATYFGELNITKGTSRWSALRSFCNVCYSSSPRISADGRLYMKGARSNGKAVFTDRGSGIVYTELRESMKRCEELSRVNVKLENSGGYSYSVDDADAVDRGIRRERYMNAVLTATPIKCADIMLKNGRNKAYSIKLKSPCRLLGILGSSAEVRSMQIGDRSGLYVSAVRFRLDSRGEYTEVELKRRCA